MLVSIIDEVFKCIRLREKMQSKIRVVHIISQFTCGGMEVVIVNMINSLPTDKYEHHVISLKKYSDDMDDRLLVKVGIHTVNKKEGKDPGFYLRLRELLRSIHPDVVNTYNIGTIDCVLSSLFVGSPVRYHSEHGRDVSDPQGINWKYNFLRKFLSHFFRRYIVVSRELKGWLDSQVKIPQRKIECIYNGVDTNLFCPRDADGKARIKRDIFSVDSFLIGNIGRLDPVKNHDYLLRVFRKYIDLHPDLDVKLVLIGDGPEKNNIIRLVKNYNLGKHVILPGAMKNIEKILPAFDIYVQSSIAEGLPMVILESMSAGVPVISTDVGGISEIIDHEKDGYLVESNNDEALLYWLNTLQESVSTRNKSSLNARKKIQNIFSLDKMVKEYDRLYSLSREK